MNTSSAEADQERSEVELLEGKMRLTYRLVTASVLVAWWARAPSLIRDYSTELSVVQVHEAYFPAFLTNAHVLPSLYLAPTVLGIVGLIRPVRSLALLHSVTLVVCAYGLLVHQISLGFQGANTAFWAGLFLVWLCSRPSGDEESVRVRATFLLQLMLGMIFLGGAAGKWTERYWNGEVMYHLMFLYQDFPKWEWLRENYQTEQLRQLSVYYSGAVVFGETVLATLPLWRPRWAFPSATLGICVMWGMATPRVIDALGPVLGLAIAGWIWIYEGNRDSEGTPSVVEHRSGVK
jgi:hypothetical protein